MVFFNQLMKSRQFVLLIPICSIFSDLMRVFFIGVCGTAMGNAAVLLKKMGHEVAGSDVSLSADVRCSCGGGC